MAFIQVVEFGTSKIEEMRANAKALEEAMGDDRKARRVVVGADRDNPGRYLTIVFFDSYEDAMANSDHPATQEFASKMMAIGDGPPTFHNLDVIDDRG